MTVVAVEIRKALICESAKPACPHCGGVIRRVRAHQGAFVAYCENRVGAMKRRNDEYYRDTCGQHVYIVGSNSGICIVVPLTRQEFTLLQERPHLTTVELYRRIGILGGAA